MRARIGPRAARIDTPGTKNTNSHEASVDRPAAREAVAKRSIRCRTASEGGEVRGATPRRFERCPSIGLLLSHAEVHHRHHVSDEHHHQSERCAENAHCLRSLAESRGLGTADLRQVISIDLHALSARPRRRGTPTARRNSMSYPPSTPTTRATPQASLSGRGRARSTPPT